MKPFPQIEGKTIVKAEIEVVGEASEVLLRILFSDGSTLRVAPNVPEESDLDIWLLHGSG